MIQIALSPPSELIQKRLRITFETFRNYTLIQDWAPRHEKFYNNIPAGNQWHWLRSDVVRFEYLSEHKNTLYLDWDVEVMEAPLNLEKLTWAANWDYWAVFNGSSTAVCREILDQGIKNVARYGSIKKIRRNWLIFYIEKIGGNIFNKEMFKHKNF